MKARGYDLANMPFATDAAEQYLLANAYPDMQGNGSTLLYSAQEKEDRQEADAQQQQMFVLEPVEQPEAVAPEANAAPASEDSSSEGSSSGRRGGGGGKTQINQLGQANRPSSGGSAFGATYGPTGDFRQFKGKENKGNETPATLNTGDARKALSQFHSGTLAARKYKENQQTGARKALMGGNVAGSEDGSGVGIGNGGLTIDPTAPPHSTDLAPIEKKVSDMADPPEKKEEEKLGFWEQLGQELIREAATRWLGAVMDGVGDTIKTQINANAASRAARKQYGSTMAGKQWNADGKCTGNCLTQAQTQELEKNGITAKQWKSSSIKKQSKYGSQTATARVQGKEQKETIIGQRSKTNASNTGNQGMVCPGTGKAPTWDAASNSYKC